MAELPVERAALEFVSRAEEVASALPAYRQYLADQLRRAASSVYLNLREGLGEFSPAEKARFFRMSVRSLREADGCLVLAGTLHPKLSELVAAARQAGDDTGPQIVRLARFHRGR